MRLYIVTYTHRHGFDTWPVFVTGRGKAPTVEEQAELVDFEGEEAGEYLEITGPFKVPADL